MKLILNFRILHLTSSKRFNYFTVKFDRFAGLGFHKGKLQKSCFNGLATQSFSPLSLVRPFIYLNKDPVAKEPVY